MLGRVFRSLIVLTLMLAALPGCQLFPSYRPAPVLVRDAETGQPISAAEVRISYPVVHSAIAPEPSAGATQTDGTVHLRASPNGDSGFIVNASAKGYMSETIFHGVDEVQALQPAGWFEDTRRRPASFVVDLFAEPHPVVELSVPPNFHGPVKVNVRVLNDAKSAGQRVFVSQVPATGEIEVVGPPLLRHVNPHDYRAKLADGTQLGRPDDFYTVGFWWLKSERQYQHYFVGSRREYEAEMRLIRYEDSVPASNSSQGKGRRGRRGQGDPSAATTSP